MFFTRIGTVVAHFLFWFGALRAGLGYFVAFHAADDAERRAWAQTYLAAADTGEAIDEGLAWVLVGAALGVLCEISARLHRRDNRA